VFESIAAEFLVLVHFGFILFVMLGGLLALRWPWAAAFHLPAAAWGTIIEFNSWICPLTPLEQSLRRAAGEVGYDGGFMEHYLLPLIYPDGLTREIQIATGIGVIVVNVVVYAIVFKRRKKTKTHNLAS
jgi:hypothetical protein